jgi:hypothetical protein
MKSAYACRLRPPSMTRISYRDGGIPVAQEHLLGDAQHQVATLDRARTTTGGVVPTPALDMLAP